MSDLEMKKKVAQEIMDLMDQKDGERLKKHPKLQAVSLEVGKVDPLEEKPESLDLEKSDDEKELDPETIEKLLEMLNGK